MDKRSQISWPWVARQAGKGIGMGGGAAALLSLLNYAKLLKEERKEEEETDETDENTMVLTLPRRRMPAGKAAAVKNSKKDPVSIKDIASLKMSTYQGPGTQYRRGSDGTFGYSTKSSEGGLYNTIRSNMPMGKWLLPSGTMGPGTVITGVLAALGTGAASAHVVENLYRKFKRKRLERKLDSAKQEYLDMLEGAKTAAPLPTNPGFPEWLLGTMALAGLFGTAGTAWLTKRLLDDRFRDVSRRGLDVPKMKRIVFRTAASDEEEEEGKRAEDTRVTEQELMGLRATIGIMMDKMGVDNRILDSADVRAAMVKEDCTKADLFKLAEDADELQAHLAERPWLTEMIHEAMYREHPYLMRIRANTMPGMELFGVTTSKTANIAGSAGALQGYLGTSKSPVDVASTIKAKKPVIPPPPKADNPFEGSKEMPLGGQNIPGNPAMTASAEAKKANLSSGILSSFIGSNMAEQNNNMPAQIAAAMTAAQERAKTEQGNKVKRVRRDFELQATDPEAQEYLNANKRKIMRMLRQMAAQGKI